MIHTRMSWVGLFSYLSGGCAVRQLPLMVLANISETLSVSEGFVDHPGAGRLGLSVLRFGAQ